MNNTTKQTLRISLNVFVIILIISGVISQVFSGILVGRGLITFLYFTTQSNLIVALYSAILIYYDIKKKELPRVLQVFHHLAVVATTLTFFVFALFLGPYIKTASYFYSLQNLALHNFGPIIALVVYLLCEYDAPKIVRPLALLSPLSYMLTTYILYFSGVRFAPHELPYFFLEYMTYGWLRINFPSFGILYWWILIILIIFGISHLIFFLQKKSQTNNKLIPLTSLLFVCFSLFFIVINTIMKL